MRNSSGDSQANHSRAVKHKLLFQQIGQHGSKQRQPQITEAGGNASLVSSQKGKQLATEKLIPRKQTQARKDETRFLFSKGIHQNADKPNARQRVPVV